MPSKDSLQDMPLISCFSHTTAVLTVDFRFVTRVQTFDGLVRILFLFDFCAATIRCMCAVDASATAKYVNSPSGSLDTKRQVPSHIQNWKERKNTVMAAL